MYLSLIFFFLHLQICSFFLMFHQSRDFRLEMMTWKWLSKPPLLLYPPILIIL
ncbi:hypothetical protein DsansV1_C25g0186961 [Dioscorea sansibarensis]